MILPLIIGGIAWMYLQGKSSGSGSTPVDSPDGTGSAGIIDTGAILDTISGTLSMGGSMQLSISGLAFIKQHEGCRLTAYWDVDGYSIGYGHHGSDVSQGQTITQAQADAYLLADCQKAIDAVNTYCTAQLAQPQFDALVDFTYNAGVGAFRGSTLLQQLNAGDASQIGYQLSRWTRSGGTVNQALVARRADEAALFNTPDFIDPVSDPTASWFPA